MAAGIGWFLSRALLARSGRAGHGRTKGCVGLRIDISWEHTWTRDRLAAQTTSNPLLLCTPGEPPSGMVWKVGEIPFFGHPDWHHQQIVTFYYFFFFFFENWGLGRMGKMNHHINNVDRFGILCGRKSPAPANRQCDITVSATQTVSYVLRLFSIIRHWIFLFLFLSTA